ncbi:MAG: hypothetical protein HS116_22550 [Planctomycetes bacterium]|nr:hypothetical protein [Planctomycetota bacterium]
MPQGKPINTKRVRQLIALGQTPSQVAKALGVGVNAVYKHTDVRARMRGKKKRGKP